MILVSVGVRDGDAGHGLGLIKDGPAATTVLIVLEGLGGLKQPFPCPSTTTSVETNRHRSFFHRSHQHSFCIFEPVFHAEIAIEGNGRL